MFNFDGARRTIGMVVTVIPSILNLFGIDVLPSFADDINQIVEGVITILGVGITLYGIIKAKGPMWFQKKKA